MVDTTSIEFLEKSNVSVGSSWNMERTGVYYCTVLVEYHPEQSGSSSCETKYAVKEMVYSRAEASKLQYSVVYTIVVIDRYKSLYPFHRLVKEWTHPTMFNTSVIQQPGYLRSTGKYPNVIRAKTLRLPTNQTYNSILLAYYKNTTTVVGEWTRRRGMDLRGHDATLFAGKRHCTPDSPPLWYRIAARRT